MSVDSRIKKKTAIFGNWSVDGESIGEGSGRTNFVYKLKRGHGNWIEYCALKVIPVIQEYGSLDLLSSEQQKEYGEKLFRKTQKAKGEVIHMEKLRGNAHVVDYLDFDFEDWSEDDCFGRDMYIRMELLHDLRSELKHNHIFSEAEIIKIGRDICKALILCHGNGILHRDIKPDNIFINKEGNYKLGDFGIAKSLPDISNGYAGTGIGSFAYMPAEQFKGKSNNRVDIYSLGLVLYELSNGNKLPFAKEQFVTDQEVIQRLSGKKLPQPSNASAQLAKVILKACAFDPKDRFSSAEEFLAALEAISVNPPPPPPPPPWLWIIIGICLLIALIYLLPKGGVPTPPTDPPETTSSVPIHPPEKTCTQIDGGLDHTVFLFSDGTVEAIGSSAMGQCDVSDWTDIVQISTLRNHTVGLRNDGTVVAVGDNADGQCNVSEWTDIVEISAGNHHTVGLKSDGSVVCVGRNQSGDCDVEKWENIKSIGTAYTNTFGLCSDGTVLVSGSFRKGKLPGWENVQSISVSDAHIVGLRSDGTVIAMGNNTYEQCDLSDWRNIASVSTGCGYTVGLKKDGTILVKGINDVGQHNAKQWSEIVYVATGLEHTIGITSDGAFVAVGANDYGQCDVAAMFTSGNDSILENAEKLAANRQYRRAIQILDDAWIESGDPVYSEAAAKYRFDFGVYNTSLIAAGQNNTIVINDGTTRVVGGNGSEELQADGWTDIVAVSAGDKHIVGLKSDGTVVSAGSIKTGRRNVDGWKNVVALSAGDSHTVALLSDGSVIATGYNEKGQCDVDQLSLAAGGKKIVAIAAGYYHTIALLEDGTVVACGQKYHGACDVENWTNIAAIYAGEMFSAGLQNDGTVVVTGQSALVDAWNFSEWVDIVNLAAGDEYLIGLKADGTVVSQGLGEGYIAEQHQSMRFWENVICMAAGSNHTVAVTSDGEILCAGVDNADFASIHGTKIKILGVPR